LACRGRGHQPGERPPHLGEPWLGLLVHNGDVFLGGRLDLARKSLAEALAWETGSCCDVHNLVSHDPPRQGRDAEVVQALHTLVDEHSGVDGDRVGITVEQGTVALLGQVADEAQHRTVKALCWLLPDVFEVHDHLVVRQRA
jgi:osmotically-inducible protein OsmY